MDPIPLASASVFLLLSALFSGYETAFFSSEGGRLAAIYNSGKKRPWHYWLRYFTEQPEVLLSVILVGNTLVNLGFTLSLLQVGAHYPPYGSAVAAAGAWVGIVVLGEIIPKTLALSRPYVFLRLGTGVIQLSFWLFYPLAELMRALQRWIESWWRPLPTLNSLSHLIEALPPELSPPSEKGLLKKLLLLRQLPVRAFMISRMDMKAIPASLSWTELKAALRQIPYIRVPVYGETLDEIKGILLIKDLLPHWSKPDYPNWQQLVRPAYFVPETKNAYELLLELQARRQAVAIGVDEFGSVAGLISLQRLLEVVFGYREEEARLAGALYEINADGSVCFQAQAPLMLVQEVLSLPTDFFQEEEVRSAENLAEFVLSLAERIPSPGETLVYRDYAFEVVEGSPQRIERIRAYRLLRGPDTPASENLSSAGAA
ncbi:MAG: hemolysin family protein [Bacteroidia bacterium]